MTITNGYATLAEYKAWVTVRNGTISTDATDDTVIEDIIEAASRYFDGQTGRHFYPDSTDADYYFQSECPSFLDLPDFASITTVSVDYAGARSYTALASTDWDAIPDNYSAEKLPIMGIVITPLSLAYFPDFRRGIKVTGKRGWSAVPDDVKEAVLSISQNLYGTRSGQSSAGRITVTASGVVIRPEDVPAFAQKIIEHYRNIL